ncbi:serine-type D-Ala-D-Ala carboxypeptidase [Striga asiatica]|uniref:Serine-type D-Ala-D-Ala carboxypeptidase n=1 Tax=Striga asiatica TaxID=4170 RepID=A0A5A7RG53_STRAF|nr:serine-type D-Ala-D-Ala carboxypeptidase [Striga asiatica]
MAAALASSPEVGSSMNMIEGFATSSTAIVSLFLCSVESPFTPGSPTIDITREPEPSGVDEGFINGDIRGVNVGLLTITGNPSKGGLVFRVAGDGDVTLDVTSRFSSRQNVHQSRFSGPTHSHQSRENSGPECAANSLQQFQFVFTHSLSFHFLHKMFPN